jgi:TonB family protein
MGDERLGRYKVLKHLASGGMADVLLARTDGIEGFERHVVVKRIRSEHAKDQRFISMFLDEARVAAGLHHQNIVQVNDIGESNGEFFFAMEYLHGEDLRKILSAVSRSGTHMPLGYVVAIVSSVASGLHYAHERRTADGRSAEIVHRDVSPSNILVGYDGSVKVVDFGIAKAAMRQAETKSGSLKGKVAYMSPEQCKGDLVDRRSDVYALGVVLYELATTTRLFKGENEYLLMDAIVNGKVPAPRQRRPDLPNELALVIMRALATDPTRRFQSADELRVALDQFAVKSGLTASTSALATYMQKLLGTRPEPWLASETSTSIERPLGARGTESVHHSWTEMPRDAIMEAAAHEDTQAAGAKTKTDSKHHVGRSRRVQAISPAAFEDTGVPAIAPRETRTSAKFGFENQSAGVVSLPPAPRRNTVAKAMMVGLPLLAVAGVATWHFGFREQGTETVAPAPAPAPPPAAAIAVPAPPPVAKEPQKIEVQLDADIATARVVFRRRIAPTPMTTELSPSDIVELVEVSAPGYKTERYWLTFDRATHLKAHLIKGSGIEEATEEQTLVALGEAEAPAAPAATPQPVKPKPTQVAAAAPTPTAAAPRRKIGHAAADETPPPDTIKHDEIAAAPIAVPEPAPAPTPAPAPPPAPRVVAPPAPPQKAEAPHAIPPATLKGLLASSTKIDVPDVVITQMKHDEKKKTNAVIKVCIGTGGEVTAASVMKSSGYAAYDDNLVNGIRGWRYRPFLVDGKTVPACSAVSVGFSL